LLTDVASTRDAETTRDDENETTEMVTHKVDARRVAPSVRALATTTGTVVGWRKTFPVPIVVVVASASARRIARVERSNERTNERTNGRTNGRVDDEASRARV